MSSTGKRVKLAVEKTPPPHGEESEWLECGDKPLMNDLVEPNEEPSGGESGSEWLERGDHPLLNDLIVKTLFGFVRRFDLKACRVVSKKWNLHTIPQMRSTFKVTIHGTQTQLINRDRRIDDFVKLFCFNELGIPFVRFQLGPFRTTEGVGQQFLQLCGETSTEIDLCLEESEGYKIEDVSELLRSCPNIKVLGFPMNLVSRSGIVKLFADSTPTFSSLRKITFYSGHDKLRRKYCTTSTEELLSVATNVSDVVVFEDRSYFEDPMDESTNGISVVLNCIEKLGIQSSIQSLHLQGVRVRHIEHLQRMGQNGLKLKALTFKPMLSDDGETNFDVTGGHAQLATTFKDTIQSLTVGQISKYSWIRFPYMQHLKSLAYVAEPHNHLTPADLDENFPSLETLDIGWSRDIFEEEEMWEKYFSYFSSAQNIKSFSVQYCMEIQTVPLILTVFPNLAKLELSLSLNSLEILRQLWTPLVQLESLSLSICVDGRRAVKLELDSVVTGIPTNTLLEIHPVVNELEKMNLEERRGRILKLTEQHSQLPSIRSLTKLRHLDLSVDVVHNKIYFTDLTPYLVFYSMDHLRHLEVKYCMFTKTCCEILTKETGLESWSFWNRCKDGKMQRTIPPFLIH